jgi:hypothetical protein
LVGASMTDGITEALVASNVHAKRLDGATL